MKKAENTDRIRSEIQTELLDRLDPGRIPEHIGIIMDGNGRWAQSQGISRIRGHQAGARGIKSVVRFADRLGVRHLSLYAFSVENWARPSFEVSALMRLIRTYIIRERNDLHNEGVKFRMLGRISELDPSIIKEAAVSTRLMADNPGLSLNLCINYGGKAEIVDALKKIVLKGIQPDEITDEVIDQHLYHPNMPPVDLVIRTGGEMRMSNFLIWESAYAEFYSTSVFWPDFDEIELLKAILDYQNRERRFGKTGEQIRGQ